MDHFISDAERLEILARKESDERAALYMGDLASLLAQPEGRRVLRHWLDEAAVFAPVSLGGEGTVKAAALSDYGKHRLAEIAAASPAEFLGIMLAGIKNISNNKELS